MRICPICHSQNGDENYYCTMCGNRLPDDPQSVPERPPVYQQPIHQAVAVYDPYDHTASFDGQDIAGHKLYAMTMYLLGIVGMIIALLGGKDSAYVQFHLRQNLKFLVVEALLVLIAALLGITIIIPIAAGICLVIVEVIKLISFFQVCGSKAKEPAIIRSLGFLK